MINIISITKGDYMRNSAQLVREVKATMAIEGHQLKKKEVDLLELCATGKASTKDIVKNLIKKYEQK